MGREGVAFTFVTPEEGNELTRIEMRINRLLKRDEIPGFVAFGKPQPTDELGKRGRRRDGGRSRPSRRSSAASRNATGGRFDENGAREDHSTGPMQSPETDRKGLDS